MAQYLHLILNSSCMKNVHHPKMHITMIFDERKHLIEKELTQANNARPLLDSWNSFDQLNTRLHGGINTGKGEEK